jgi:hypothetical protein
MKSKIYIETSIISYYASKPNRDVIIAGRQHITQEIWTALIEKFEPFVSVLVIQEASRGNIEAANKRISYLKDISVLEIIPQAYKLAEILISSGAIPINSEEDALHIAIASTTGMDVLLTWNFSHINNAFKKMQINNVIESQGFIVPVICSPEDLIGELMCKTQ